MSRPLIVGALAPDEPGDELGYRVYTQAYAVEMQIDDEVEATTVLLAPYETVHVFSSDAEESLDDDDFDDDFEEDDESEEGGSYRGSIPLCEMGDVHAGAYGIAEDVEMKSLDELHRERLRWVLLPQSASTRITAVISAGLTPVLRVKVDEGTADLEFLRDLLSEVDGSSLVLAIEPTWTFAEGQALTAESVGELCRRAKEISGGRVLYAGSIEAEKVGSLVDQDGVDGVFFHHDHSGDEVCHELLSALDSLG